MDSLSDPMPRPAAPQELCFLLRVRLACHGSPWHAELTAPGGAISAFRAPIDLARYLACMEPGAHRHVGLR